MRLNELQEMKFLLNKDCNELTFRSKLWFGVKGYLSDDLAMFFTKTKKEDINLNCKKIGDLQKHSLNALYINIIQGIYKRLYNEEVYPIISQDKSGVYIVDCKKFRVIVAPRID